MPDPSQHADNRGVVESILRYIPGFRGYLEKDYRRESDRLQREYLADQLERAKTPLADFTRLLVDNAQIDYLDDCDRIRNRLERVVNRLRAQMHGYSGFFDFVQVDESRLDAIYDHDMAAITSVTSVVDGINGLATQFDAKGEVRGPVSEVLKRIDAVESEINQREDLLRGLDPNDSPSQ